MSAGEYLPAAGMGWTIGAGVGNAIGGYFQADAEKAVAKLKGQTAWLNASAQAMTMRYNAAQIAEAAGGQEYALYKEQERRMASMEAATAANGVALEGTAVDMQAEQAAIDASNRDALIEQSKNQQAQLLLGAQQTVQEGRNQVAYYNAMGKAAAKSAIVGGFGEMLGSVGKTMEMGANNYMQTGSMWGIRSEAK